MLQVLYSSAPSLSLSVGGGSQKKCCCPPRYAAATTPFTSGLAASSCYLTHCSLRPAQRDKRIRPEVSRWAVNGLPREHDQQGASGHASEPQRPSAPPSPAPISDSVPSESTSEPGTHQPSSPSSSPSPAPSSSPSSSPPAPSAPNPDDPDIDTQLRVMWEDMKKQLKKTSDPESARLIDSLSYEDLMGPDPQAVFRKLANTQLAPVFSAMGLNEDPFTFFVELIKLATFLQFVTCGMLFYGAELWGHLDTGDALRVTAGLAFGYLTRPFFKLEHFLYPIYEQVLQVFQPDISFEVMAPTSSDEQQSTLNKLGITIAIVFLVPQLLFGWTSAEGSQFVGPMALGWLFFDLSYLSALLITLKR